ncbi:MAG: antifreeze protein [Pseudomonadota bacterium]
MKRQYPDPWALWSVGLNTWFLMAEAQAVIAMRMMGMAGYWNVTPTEDARMITEKMVAFPQAMLACSHAALSGKSSHEVAQATLRPLRRKTRSNARRLARRGYKLK